MIVCAVPPWPACASLHCSAPRSSSRRSRRVGPRRLYPTDGKFNPAALAVLRESYVDMKLFDKEPDMSKLVTDAYLPKK